MTTPCWKCGQPVPRGASRCAACGAPLQAPAARRPQAPTQPATPAAPQSLTHPPLHVLGNAFAGTPAGLGRRLLALTIDVVLMAGGAALAFLLTRSWPIAVVVAAEIAAIFVVIQARTGASLGMMLTRVRVSQEDAPRSPGLGRAGVRALIVAAGSLVAGVGAWVVEASGFADNTGKKRSWADRAAGTVVVSIPTEQDRATAAAITARGGGRSVAINRAAGALPVAEAAAPQPVAPVPVPVPIPVPSAPVAATPELGFIDDHVGTVEGLLLVFDTGQRARLSVPVAANLGRAPLASAEGDQVLAVDDPARTISKNHARLEHSGGQTWVTDLGSTNGTSLVREDGALKSLAVGSRTAVDDGVRVRIGDRTFTVTRLMGEE